MSKQTPSSSGPTPLTGVRVIDMSDGKAELCGRFLAELGADVILIEPPQGATSRRQEPVVEGVSLYFATHNANKRGVSLDIANEGDCSKLLQLIDSADIFIETARPGSLDGYGLGAAQLRQRRPDLVVLSITEFGQTGPWRDWAGTENVHLAAGGMLCRSGLPEVPEPLLPPGFLVYETAAIQAAWAAVIAYWNRLQTGSGDHLDFSVFESTLQVLDPAMGVTGSAQAGKSALESSPRGRPEGRYLYPIFPCADGHVRVCILNPRQWQGMFGWLGSPEEFADPSYGNIAKRFKESGRIYPLIGKLFKDQPAAELVAEGQRRGVPIAKLATTSDVLRDEHFNARGAFAELEFTPGKHAVMPSGFVEVDGERGAVSRSAPQIGQHNAEVFKNASVAAKTSGNRAVGQYPFEGLRVLDLGVIVAGAELGRLFADMGAEVIKVENRAFPDGGRQSSTGDLITPSFTMGHRGKLSLGLNLRSDKGKELFKQLAAKSDMVFSNFKPGTMESLGLGYDVLREINPRIIMADSSALGRTGPQSRSMGYGPLVRASSGLSRLWSYPEREGSFSDAVTIYPDHFAARVAAVAVAAALVRREQTGVGGTVSVSQAECILNAMSHLLLRESLQPGSIQPRGNKAEFNAPDGLFPCAGEDEWCVVSVRDDDDWKRLCQAIGRDDLLKDQRLASTVGRLSHRDEVDGAVAAWTGERPPSEVMTTLQSVGVPAAAMLRLTDLLAVPQLQERNFFRTLVQPGIEAPLPTENGPVRSQYIPVPDIRPAPFQGEHTVEVIKRLLGLSDAEIAALVEAGDLEPGSAPA